MKIIHITLTTLFIAFFTLSITAQEKKIAFDKGTLKICSNKNFNISGYDGKEVIITSNTSNQAKGYAFVSGSDNNTVTIAKGFTYNSNTEATTAWNDSTKTSSYVVIREDSERKKGLKKMGSRYENEELGINFKIEEKDGVLTFSDYENQFGNSLTISGKENYDIKIPNSLKLEWKSDNCQSTRTKNNVLFYNSDPSTLSSFSGEVQIESTLNNIVLTDVTGMVAINNVGGNVTVKFDKAKPENLYSIYSNNGFIDMQIPKNSSIQVDVTGKAIYSDVDFEILEEKVIDDFGHTKNKMVLEKGSGKVKIKLDAGYGNVYLRQN